MNEVVNNSLKFIRYLSKKAPIMHPNKNSKQNGEVKNLKKDELSK